MYVTADLLRAGKPVVTHQAIRAEGSLTGDVVCASIRIEDGGYFKGSITIRERNDKPEKLETL